MREVRKVVRFYDTVVMDRETGEDAPIESDFWSQFLSHLEGSSPESRELEVSDQKYYGEAMTCSSPAARYLNLGRVRSPADRPDQYRPGQGLMGPWRPGVAGDQLSEGTWVLPFGARCLVAVMSPTAAVTRSGTMGAWITKACGLPVTRRVALVPVIDPKMREKLESGVGASRLLVRVPPGARVPTTGGGEVGRAVRAAREHSDDGMSMELTFSLGGTRGHDGIRSRLLKGAEWVLKGEFADKAEVNLQVERGDGVRTERHNLLNDVVTASASFKVSDEAPPSDLSVISGMNKAIDEFRQRL